MSQFVTHLKQALKQDISDLDKLTKLLAYEKQLLKTRKSKEIETLAGQKSTLIAQLEKRGKEKARLFGSSGLGIRPGHVETALRSLNDDELMSLWEESRDKLNNCKDRNLVNGAVINRSRQRVGRLMDIIRGKNNSQNLYGQQGKESTYSANQRIAKA